MGSRGESEGDGDRDWRGNGDGDVGEKGCGDCMKGEIERVHRRN